MLLKHLKSSEVHWLHPDLAVAELTRRYEQQHLEAEWRSVLGSLCRGGALWCKASRAELTVLLVRTDTT